EEVADAAAQHKQVPDAVGKGHAFEQVEDHAQGIDDAASGNQGHTPLFDFLHQFSRSENDHPAHQQVNGDRQDAVAGAKDQLEANPGEGQPPDDGKQGPAHRAAHVDQQERGVGTGNQQVDGTVVDNFEHPFQSRVLEAVIKRGGQIQKRQGHAINGEAGNFPGVGIQSGIGQ